MLSPLLQLQVAYTACYYTRMLHQYSLTQRVAVLLISIAAVGVWLFGSQLPQLVSSLPQQLLPIQTNSYNYNYNTCNDSDSDGKELCEKVEQHNHGYKESTSMGNQDSKFEGDWEFIGRSNGVNTYTRKVVQQ